MATLTLAISGSGGAGAISTGEMLLAVAGKAGYHGILKKTFSPQIRGGESAAIVRLGDQAVAGFDGGVDVLVVFDWKNFERFADEVPVTANTLVLENRDAGTRPGAIPESARVVPLDAGALAKAADSDWINVVFLGVIAAALEVDYGDLETVVLARLAKHATQLQQSACRALAAGFAAPTPEPLATAMAPLVATGVPTGDNRLLASGNQMAALGAIEAGVRFVAAYPITPASDLLEFIARHIEPLGGHLVQAEDELAAINMIIGAGFGGVPALTATSGPGLSLMVEGMGLAVASETPAVVIDVMRGGPSTGIPTKSEQSDFNLAVYGLHGDAPHLVLACNSIADCHYTTAWAVVLARQLQTLVIVLSDQFLGQSLQVLDAPEAPAAESIAGALERPLPNAAGDGEYRRYRDSDSGVSPMALPGDPGCMFTADGLEHRQDAVPSPAAAEHQRQLEKRRRKLENFDYGASWVDISGASPDNAVILCWGSVTASALEARSRLAGTREACVISLRLLAPLQKEALAAQLRGASSILVVEQNHDAQFFHYLRGQLPGFDYRSLALPGPRLITADDILAALGE